MLHEEGTTDIYVSSFIDFSPVYPCILIEGFTELSACNFDVPDSWRSPRGRSSVHTAYVQSESATARPFHPRR